MKKAAFALIVLILALAFPARADVALDIKLHFFGPAVNPGAGSLVATSFSLKSLRLKTKNPGEMTATFAPEALLIRLQKAFNNPGLALLTSGDLAWRADGPPSVTQVVQVNNRDYALVLTPRPAPGTVNFKVAVVEGADKKIKSVLLDTEIVLPDREVAMLGFRDSGENSYFIAFYVQVRSDSLAKDALRLASGDRPRKIKDVQPVYPVEAREKGVSGAVVLEALIDASGRVRQVQALSSPAPVLTEAAKAAVSQWEFEPYLVNGKAKDVIARVMINFRPAPEDKAAPAGDALTRLEDSQKLKLVKMVKPVYPEEAKMSRIQGAVILEAVVDENGKVKEVRPLKSQDPLLTAAAIAAVKGWEYEPFVKDGKAKPVVFTITVTFALN